MDASEQNPPCHPVIVHTYGLTREAEDKLFDRIADAAHANDETLFCSGGNECHLCEDERPEPDWADVREAARKSGYRLRRRGPVGPPVRCQRVVRWELECIPAEQGDLHPSGGFNLTYWWEFRDGDDDAGLTVEIDLDDHDGSEIHLWDTIPTRALAALTTFGLDGGTP